MNWDEGNWDEGSWDSPSPPIFLPTTKPKTKYKTMASNPTPDNADIARALADRMADGCHLHEVAMNIKQNTETVMRASSLALKNAQMAAGAAKANVGAMSDALKGVDATASATLTNCRLRLVNLLGQFWSPAWEATGFPDQSTAVPENQGLRLTLLENLAAYFTLNPTKESVDLGATAAICTAQHTLLSDARADHGTAKTNLTTRLNQRDDAFKSLRKRIRGLIEELTTLIAPDDPRWEDFGLTIPANPSAPLGIDSLTAEAAGNGKLHAEWTYATRMVGTRLLTQRTTGTIIDPGFINAGTADGLEKTLSGFEVGVIVKIKVIPYNDGGDGPESPTVTVTIT
jgi:hypothetical protein